MKKAVIVIPVYRVFTPTEAFAFRQCVDVLGSHPISVICPKNLDVSFIDGFRKNIDIDYVRFEPKYFEGIKGYNNLLLTPSFYERFADYEYMLIYQLDAFVFHDSLNYWVDKGYDYIGAPWVPNSSIFQATFGDLVRWIRRTRHPAGTTLRITHAQMHYRVGNGGFSLRNIAKMKETCERFADEISRLPAGEARAQEDIFFSLYIQKRAGITVPGWKEAAAFSIENNPRRCLRLTSGKLPFGCHGWSRGGVWKKFWHRYIPCNPECEK